MNLSAPLESFMGNLDAVAMLIVARAGMPLTGRRVARLAGTGTPANIRLALQRLAKIGLVIAVPAPHATMYSANRDHLLWPAVEIALNARDELARRIVEFASVSAPTGVTIALYGSVARGDSTRESDIDLLVVFPDGVDLADRDEFVTVLRDKVQLWSGNDVQIYDLSESALSQQRIEGDPIVHSWENEGLILFGDNVRGHERFGQHTN